MSNEQLVSIVHDVGNVLTAALGHLSFLRLSENLPEESQARLHIVEQSVQRAAKLLESITRPEQPQAVATVPAIDIREIVERSVELAAATLSASTKLHLELVQQPVWVKINDLDLERILMNLLLNARDAVMDGGEINVRLSVNEKALIEVIDTGAGMNPELRERIFTPYFSTKGKRGTGIGLASVRTKIESYHGSIEVKSAPGAGSCFRLRLPLAGPPEQSAADQEALCLSPQGYKGKILVVDDEDSVRLVVHKGLELFGFEVISTADAFEGIELYRKVGAELDLVILDMLMPELSGAEVFEKIREMDPEAKVLIASGYSTEESSSQVLKQGGMGLINKPFTIDELLKRIGECLGNPGVISGRTT